MPKYGSFEKWCVSRKSLPVERKQSSISTCLTREHMCNFANNLYTSFSLLYPNWHADVDLACKNCFLVLVFVSTKKKTLVMVVNKLRIKRGWGYFAEGGGGGGVLCTCHQKAIGRRNRNLKKKFQKVFFAFFSPRRCRSNNRTFFSTQGFCCAIV